MPRRVFISLTHSDTPIAEALRDIIRALFGDFLKVHFSTSKELETGIGSGEDWFQWIVDKVVDCDFALLLVTPSSLHKPWILWEAGAVAGAALASQAGPSLRKVRPLVYQIPTDLIPSPIRDSKVQFRRGDSQADVKRLLQEILNQYRNDPELSADRVTEFGENLKDQISGYLARVNKALLDAPAVPTVTVLDEWRQRLDDVLRQNRASEVRHLHDWMDIAFGRSGDSRPRPLDLRIHVRLGEIYMNARDYERAVLQLEQARELAPRDLFVLRTLGRAYLENGKRDLVQAVLDRIAELDKDAFRHNTECAALQGRFYRSGGDSRKAADVYRGALGVNPESHYLATLVAEASLEAGDRDAATIAYRQGLDILSHLNEANTWTHASAANAQFFLGNETGLAREIDAIRQTKPGADQLAAVERGLETVSKHVDGGDTRLRQVLATLRA